MGGLPLILRWSGHASRQALEPGSLDAEMHFCHCKATLTTAWERAASTAPSGSDVASSDPGPGSRWRYFQAEDEHVHKLVGEILQRNLANITKHKQEQTTAPRGIYLSAPAQLTMLAYIAVEGGSRKLLDVPREGSARL